MLGAGDTGRPMSIKPFVFVSHASDDKKRMRPLLEALIAAGLKIWLDKPEEAGFTARECEQYFYCIAAGQRWEDEIDKAKRDAACILVCWSRRAIDKDVMAGSKRLTWMGEADYGRTEGKLVSCTIDDVSPAALPGTFGLQHVTCVDAGRLPEYQRAALATVIAAINDKIAQTLEKRLRANLQDKPAVGFRDPFLRYYANRAVQQNEIFEAVDAIIADSGARPVIVAAPDNERPDEFFDRMCRDSTKVLPNGSRWKAIWVEWPRSGTPKQFADAYRRLLWAELRMSGPSNDAAIAGAIAAKGVSSVVFHRIHASDWSIGEPGRIQAWLDYWHGLAAQSRVRVVPWLQIKMTAAKPGWLDCPPGRSQGAKTFNREIWQAVSALGKKARRRPSDPVVCVPPMLAPIRFGDADNWIDLVRSSTDLDRQRLERIVKGVFADPDRMKVGVSLENFADGVLPLFAE